MNDRIAELRALLKASRDNPTNWSRPETVVATQTMHEDLKLALDRHLPALLDCAEALRRVTQALEWHAHGRGRGIDDGPLLGTADAVALGVAALARLNGDDHAG